MSDISAPDIQGRPGGGFVKKLLVWLVMALLLGGGGFGAGLYFAGNRLSPADEVLRLIEQEKAQAEDQAEGAEGPVKQVKDMPETPVFKTSYFEFPDPLTTNLAGSRRFLQLGIGVSTQYDAKVIENVETHMMALRSDILGVVGGYDEATLTTKEGRDALAADLRAAINARLEKLEGFGGVEDVFFPTFVLQ